MKRKLAYEIGMLFEYVGLRLLAYSGDGYARGRLIALENRGRHE